MAKRKKTQNKGKKRTGKAENRVEERGNRPRLKPVLREVMREAKPGLLDSEINSKLPTFTSHLLTLERTPDYVDSYVPQGGRNHRHEVYDIGGLRTFVKELLEERESLPILTPVLRDIIRENFPNLPLVKLNSKVQTVRTALLEIKQTQDYVKSYVPQGGRNHTHEVYNIEGLRAFVRQLLKDPNRINAACRKAKRQKKPRKKLFRELPIKSKLGTFEAEVEQTAIRAIIKVYRTTGKDLVEPLADFMRTYANHPEILRFKPSREKPMTSKDRRNLEETVMYFVKQDAQDTEADLRRRFGL